MSKLLSMKEPSDNGLKRDTTALSNRILRYVIATCYPKMNRRMKHRLSWSYIQSLGGITTFQFSESEYDGLPPRDEIENDRHFLVKFLLSVASGSICNTKTPKLLEQAQLACDRKPFQLYTNETCIEFHQLFLEIMKGFETSLDELAKTRGAEEVSTQGSVKFKQNVLLVSVHGYGLQKLAKSAGLKMHLKTITPLLINSPTLRSESEMSMLNASAEQQELELDRDLEAIRPFASKEGVETPLWMSYIKWLKLMVAHFDAVSTLVGYVTGQYFNHGAISVRILVAPPMDRRLLPWQELFTDSTLFPIIPDYLAGINSRGWGIRNADILRFLSKALETSSQAEAAKATWDKKDVKQTILNIETVQSSILLGWEERAEEILVKLRGLNGLSPGADLFQEISNDIQSLCESSTFFASLGDTRGFSGTLHCEAFLMSLLHETTTGSKDTLAQMMVGFSSTCFIFIVSFLVKGLSSWIDYWIIGMLVPGVSMSALCPRTRQIYCKRLSRYCYSLHSAHMASRKFCGSHEPISWWLIETKACGHDHKTRGFYAQLHLGHRFMQAFGQHLTN